MGIIKKVTEAELPVLEDIGRETFFDTFYEEGVEAQMEQYLDQSFGQDPLKAEFKHPSSSFYLVYHKDEVAGYMKINVGQAQNEFAGENGLEIERLYIRQNYKRLGLGKAMINFAVEQARDAGKDFVWLGVWEHNRPAYHFYEKMGFREIGEHPFNFAGEVQRDLVMRRDLKGKEA